MTTSDDFTKDRDTYKEKENFGGDTD